ncbi:hypothetical protein [Oceanibium sediminis]|nr:hypothetical protein [Oceanibium sediminis]
MTTYEGTDPPEGAEDKETHTIGSRPSVHPDGPRITRAPIIIEDADKL